MGWVWDWKRDDLGSRMLKGLDAGQGLVRLRRILQRVRNEAGPAKVHVVGEEQDNTREGI